MTTILAQTLFALASLVFLASARFDYPNFYNTINLNLQGSAVKNNGDLLLSGSAHDQAGSAWVRTPIDLTRSWTAQFQFSIVGGGGDGFAFVIQGMSDAAIGADASQIGYAGITNSIAMEFDTYQNADWADPNGNHISIHTKQAQANSANEANSICQEQNPSNGGKSIVLASGDTYSAMVRYVASPTKFLTFSFNQDELTNCRVNQDLAQYLGITNGKAWIGFTSATGGKSEDHFILNWQFYYDNTTEPCMNGFYSSNCYPSIAGADVSCASLSDCEVCTNSPYPCAWDGGCAFMSGRGGATSVLDCPSSADKSWIWIVVACICIVLATLGLLYYFRRRQLKQAGATNSSSGYAQVEEAQTSNYAQM